MKVLRINRQQLSSQVILSLVVMAALAEGGVLVEGLVENYLHQVVDSMVAVLVANEVVLMEAPLVVAVVLVEEVVSPKTMTLNTANAWVPFTLQMG